MGRPFLSYSHRDGAELAQRLFEDLHKDGQQPWLDRARIAAGAEWTREIERELDSCDAVIALMRPGAFDSEICRAEQLRSLRKGNG